ncbi:MAG: M18 family aminopeptidase [Blautia sp.]|nr:M18 family aminopeptidase [Blautia sp.]
MKTIGTKREINRELRDFLDQSPNAYFAVENFRRLLEEEGFMRLTETQKWELSPGNSYYVTRNDAAIVAFRLPEGEAAGFQMFAAHCDSPAFRVKPNAEIVVENRLVKLNVEKYGGILLYPWLDRPLSVAGRLFVRAGNKVERHLVNIDRDLLCIPSLAIHMNREANKGINWNIQKDLLPLFSMDGEKGDFLKLLAKEAGVKAEDILETDLFLYNRMKSTLMGAGEEFLMSGHLDDLQCAFSGMRGLLSAKPEGAVALCAIFDNEEVGSKSRQGAAGSFLADTLKRINRCLGGGEEEYLCRLASSFLVSADNAHGVHPNYPDKADPTNRPQLNGGIVLKYAANQKYTSDGYSGSLFRSLCEAAGVPLQTFVNRSDMEGGSTLGNLSLAQVTVPTVDIGLPQLAMHSAYETAGTSDTLSLVKAVKVLFESSMRVEEGSVTLQGAGGDYRILPCREGEENVILSLLEETYQTMENPSFYARHEKEREWVKGCLTPKKGLGLKAISPKGELAGFLLVEYPGEDMENLGRDIQLPEEELTHVAHMDSVMVLPAHRGHHLEKRFLLAAESYLPPVYHHLLSSASPENGASCHSIEGAGYKKVVTKEKYGGYLRNIYYKEI